MSFNILKKNIHKKEEVDRTGIEVGDYVEYTPPVREGYSAYLTEAYTDSLSNNSIGQQYKIWRVLNKNENGTLDLIPAFKDNDVSNKTIYFNGSKGYNNFVYILDDLCKTLYEKTNSDANKSITARSIDYEDITKLLVQNEDGKGIRKIENFITTELSSLRIGVGKVVGKTGNKITYKDNTYYPVLHQNLANPSTKAIENESDPFYTSAAGFELNAITNGKVETKPNRLQVEYTKYNGTIEANDFNDYDATTEKSKKYDVIFGTETRYLLASRFTLCGPNGASFGMREVWGSKLYNGSMTTSVVNAPDIDYGSCVCPIITIGSNVKVNPAKGTNDENHPHTVVIPE